MQKTIPTTLIILLIALSVIPIVKCDYQQAYNTIPIDLTDGFVIGDTTNNTAVKIEFIVTSGNLTANITQYYTNSNGGVLYLKPSQNATIQVNATGPIAKIQINTTTQNSTTFNWQLTQNQQTRIMWQYDLNREAPDIPGQIENTINDIISIVLIAVVAIVILLAVFAIIKRAKSATL